MRQRDCLKNKLRIFLKDESSSNRLIVVNSYDKMNLIADVLNDVVEKDDSATKILCFKSKVPESIKGFLGRTEISEDYLDMGDYEKIDKYVFEEVSKNWHKKIRKEYKDIFLHRDIELSNIAEYNFQTFLIPRIKALTVLQKVFDRKKYDNIFLIDSNGELNNFDKLIKKLYGAQAFYFEINEKVFVKDLVRKYFASFLTFLLDAFSSFLGYTNKETKLIDARLFNQLNPKEKNSFALAPLEKGFVLRAKCLLKKYFYIAFDVNEAKRGTIGRPQNFNIEALKNQFIFEDIHYWELVEDKLSSVILLDFKRFRKNIDSFFKKAKRHKVKVVILRNDLKELEKTIVFAAKKIGIQTLVVQHGMLAEPNGHSKIFADKITVWGDRASRWYKSYGNKEDKLEIVGSPFFDRIPDVNEKCNIENKLGLTKRKFLITLIAPGVGQFKLSSFTVDDVTERLIVELKKVVASIGDANLVIKLHPNERAKTFKRLIKAEEKDKVVLTENFNINKLIKESSLVVTMESTAALSAIIFDKPLVVINLGKRKDLAPYAVSGVAEGIYKENDIKDVIEKALNKEKAQNPKKESFINDFLYRLDGKANERILEKVKKI